MKVTTQIKVYEVDGEKTEFDYPKLTVNSHWNLTQLVEVEVEGKRLAVAAKDLIMAIKNAENHS